MHILITRPQQQAETLAAMLSSRGNSIITSPLLTIEPCLEQREALEAALSLGPQAVIITSSNGADALAALTPKRDIPVVAVGEASADAAQQHGFAAIAAGGTVTALVDFIQHHYAPANGSLLYASGEVISSDFTPYLQQEGFSLTRIALYRAHPATGLSHALQQVLIARQPLAALFYSERTARIFSRLVQQEGLEAGITHATAFTLSAPIASALKELPWNTIHVAAHPNQAALIELLSNRL